VGKWGLKWNNVTGTLKVNDTSKTALLITDNGTVPVNFTVADTTRIVVVGNGTFLLIGWNGTYIVPPYDKPIDVLSLPLYGQKSPSKPEQNTSETASVTNSSNQNIFLYGALAALLIALAIAIKRR